MLQRSITLHNLRAYIKCH